MKVLRRGFIAAALIISILGTGISSHAEEIKVSSGEKTMVTNMVATPLYPSPDVNTAPIAILNPSVSMFSYPTDGNFYALNFGGVLFYVPKENVVVRSQKEVVDFATEREKAISAIYTETNTLRKSLGMSELVMDETLNKIAQVRADDMASLQYFSHYKDNQLQLAVVGKAVGLSAKISSGENIARTTSNTDIGDRFMAMWISSDGHYKNMKDKLWKKVGIAIAQDATGRYYGVHIFSN